jgi:hypothetical protein
LVGGGEGGVHHCEDRRAGGDVHRVDRAGVGVLDESVGPPVAGEVIGADEAPAGGERAQHVGEAGGDTCRHVDIGDLARRAVLEQHVVVERAVHVGDEVLLDAGEAKCLGAVVEAERLDIDHRIDAVIAGGGGDLREDLPPGHERAHEVVRPRRVPKGRVAACPTVHVVVSGTAGQSIIPGLTKHNVVASASGHGVATVAAEHHVVAAEAEHRVGTAKTGDLVATIVVAVEGIRAGAARDHAVTGIQDACEDACARAVGRARAAPSHGDATVRQGREISKAREIDVVRDLDPGAVQPSQTVESLGNEGASCAIDYDKPTLLGRSD